MANARAKQYSIRVPGKPRVPRVKKPMPKLEAVTPIKLPKEVKPASAEEMMIRTVVMVLTINGIGNRRKVDPDLLNINEAEIDKNWLNTTKRLFEAEELDKITSICNKAKAYVMTRALPSPIKTGVYLLPNEFTEEVSEKLRGFRAEIQPYIEKLANRLEEHKAEAKERLGPLYVAEQYPTADYLRQAFDISWRYLRVDSANGLSKALAEEERRKAEASWAETREVIQQVLRGEFLEKVNHFIERLTPNALGKTSKVREGSLEKFQDFLSTFNPRNITNDRQMQILVEKAKALMNGADAEGIQDNDQWREHMKHGFETIKAVLDPMIVDRPHRAIRLED
jgi:hypothetical protein